MDVCFYFQIHQPFRLNKYSVFDIGKNKEYFDEKSNKEIMKKVAKNCYIPANELMLKLIKKHKGKFKIAFSITGTALDQFKKYVPEVIESFKKLADTGCVEFLSETYYHSLSYMYSKKEFKEQIELHKKTMKELFNQEPKVFRYTELIYNDDLSKTILDMGYKGMIAEGADKLLGWRSPNYVYKSPYSTKILLKNYKLSDDIAFRFSNKEWENYPLTTEKYAKWIHEQEGDVINLFMDYETIGEHQPGSSGIFRFMGDLPTEILKNSKFVFPSEALDFRIKGKYDSPDFVSWADVERDLTAWLGNKMQKEAAKEIYLLEEGIKETNDEKLIEDWRKLQTSDHFYYMCTKWFNDGEVHKYFNPYETPYDAFVTYMNILNDIIVRVKTAKKEIILNN